jgi:hypothetical protein
MTVLMIIVFNSGRALRTPVVLVAAQGDSDRAAGTPWHDLQPSGSVYFREEKPQ